MQKLDHAFKQSQTLPYHIAIIADGGIKKSNVASVVAHIWVDNHVTNQLSLQAMNITPLEAELMSMCLGLTPTPANNSAHNITIITDSMGMAKKLLESRPNPHQRAVLSIINLIKSFLSKDNRNAIHFWQCPKKAKWPRHKLVDDQVKTSNDTPTLSSKNSHLFSQKKEVDDILKEWQTTFATSQKKGQLFLDFEDEKQHVITPTYTKGGSWLPIIGFTNALCARFTRMTTGHAPIGEYCQHFFPNTPLGCPCGQAELQTREHIVMQCPQYDPATRPINIVINSFIHFLNDNPSAFCFDNG